MDLDFVDDMIDWATTNYNISESQIFTTGHSYGAYFSYYVARWRSEDIAAFAEHSGGINNIPVPALASGPTPKLNGILLHAVDDGLVTYSGTQNLYDALVANGHNVYHDGIGDDGIIEVDGWGPDNHRYRKAHNQTQWDFFLSVAPTPEMNVERDGVPIADESSDTVAQSEPGVAKRLTFDIRNTGTAELTVVAGRFMITGLTNCVPTVQQSPATSVAPGGATALVVDVTPSSPGRWSFHVTLTSNDDDESSYDWTAEGVAISIGIRRSQ